jgi:filamentous hemagglutinin
MAGPFQVENPGVGITYTLDQAGNVTQAGNLTVTGTTYSGATVNNGTVTNSGPSTFAGTATFSSEIVANAGINSSGGISVLLGGTIGSGNAAILGTAASGTQLSDVTRDYMVYIGVTAGGAAATLTIGPASTAINTLYAAATCGVGTQYSFRLPAGWYVRFQGTAAITQQIAVSC